MYLSIFTACVGYPTHAVTLLMHIIRRVNNRVYLQYIIKHYSPLKPANQCRNIAKPVNRNLTLKVNNVFSKNVTEWNSRIPKTIVPFHT